MSNTHLESTKLKNIIIMAMGLPKNSLSGKETKDIHKAMQLLLDSEFPKSLHGLVQEDDDVWTTTSVQFKLKGSVEKWHCHGEGLTPILAMKDMIRQLKNFKKGKL